MQANVEEFSSLQGSLTFSYTESSKRLHKDQHKTNSDAKKILVQVQHGTFNF